MLVHRSLRILQAVVGFALVALFLTGPATAWKTHEVSHLSSPVAADSHHHHDDGAAAEHAGEHEDSTPEQDKDGDGGHDHLPSFSAGLSAMLMEPPFLESRLVTPPVLEQFASKAPPDRTSSPQIRPPRFG